MKNKTLIPLSDFVLEQKKDIVGYEEFYQISNWGKIYSKERVIYDKIGNAIRTNKVKEIKPRKGKYLMIGLNKDRIQKQFLIHRLVAQHFIPNPENKPQVNHIDGNKYNNISDNLEWATVSENIKHAFKTGLKKPTWLGKKLSPETVLKMSEMKKGNIPHNKGKKMKEIVHGTLSGYNYNKCRCKLCKKANTDYCKSKRPPTPSALQQIGIE